MNLNQATKKFSDERIDVSLDALRLYFVRDISRTARHLVTVFRIIYSLANASPLNCWKRQVLLFTPRKTHFMGYCIPNGESEMFVILHCWRG